MKQANSQTPIVRELGIQWMNQVRTDCELLSGHIFQNITQISVYYGDRIIPQLSSFLISILPHLGSGEEGLISSGSDELNHRLIELVPINPFHYIKYIF